MPGETDMAAALASLTECLGEVTRVMGRVTEVTAAATEATKELRADLKRREARDLEAAGRIPATAAPRATGSTATPSGAVSGDEPRFRFGRGKDQPVRGASMSDLEYYRAACQRTLDDPGKAKFHKYERPLMDAIDTEIRRQSGTVDTQAHDGFPDGPGDFGPPPDEEAPF